MIDKFSGQYAFLSNFYIDENGNCVEKYFQAAKAVDIKEAAYILFSSTPAKAKHRGKQCKLRPDWEFVKLEVMEALLWQKFSQGPLLHSLLETGDEELVEGNDWGDTYWGVCNGVGENQLGKILMKIRKELKK